jgi:hypothetical protein
MFERQLRIRQRTPTHLRAEEPRGGSYDRMILGMNVGLM